MTTPHADNSLPHGSTLFVLSGPSGAGKGTVLARALPRLQKIRTSISVTTRPPRPTEVDGRDYFFISPADFEVMRGGGDLLEHAEVHGHWYGTPRTWVLEQLRAGTDVVLEIDVQGALQVQAAFPEAVLVFIAPPSWEELARRLRGRGTESEEVIARRLSNARREMQYLDRYQYLVINDRLRDAVTRLAAIVLAERCRPWKQDVSALRREEADHG